MCRKPGDSARGAQQTDELEPDSSPSDEALPVDLPPAAFLIQLKSTQPTEQKQVTGLVYMRQIMAWILWAYQIATWAYAKLSRDSSGQFELVAYPPQAFQYVLFTGPVASISVKQGRLENRRGGLIIRSQMINKKY